MSIAAACLALLVASPASFASQSSPRYDGAVAEANRWYTQGGCAARTGLTETQVPREPVRAAWTYAARGTIEGEPIVWGDHVVVAIHVRGKSRELRVFDLSSGQEVGRRISFATELPLAPTIWGSLILVRAGDSRIEGYRIGKRGIRKTWTYRSDDPVGPPLLFEDEAYICTGGALERLAVGKNKPQWRVEAGVSGSVSLMGENVFAVARKENGAAAVVKLARKDGSGSDIWRVPVPPESITGKSSIPFQVSVHPTMMVVDTGQKNSEAGRFSGIPGTAKNDKIGAVLGIDQLTAFPVPWKFGWIGHSSEMGLIATEKANFMFKDGASQSNVLVYATPKMNAVFALDGVSPTSTRDVGLVGPRAFDLETREVLWRYSADKVGRAIPAQQSVLVVVGDKNLVCLRADRDKEQDQAWRLEETVDEGALVLRSGEVERGGFVRSGDKLVQVNEGVELANWRDSEPVATFADSEIMALFNKEGRVVESPSPALTIRAIDLLDDLSKAPELLKLAKEAERSGSETLMRGIIQNAWDLGAEVPTRLERSLEKLGKKKPKINERAVAQVTKSWDELRANPAGPLWAAFEARHESTPKSLEFALLREMLRRDGKFAPAKKEVFTRVEESVAKGVTSGALDWLDYLQAAASTPIRVWHHPAGKKDSEVEHAERLIARAQALGWRKKEADLLGFESENLLVLSSAKRPGAVARCLAMGEVVCKALDELFADGKSVRDKRYPLTIYLYGSKEEYLRESSRGRGGSAEAGSGLAWTAGHFSLNDKLSRLFIPDDEASLKQVMSTFAHELTHHWLTMRCPLYSLEESLFFNPKQKGFWIVEGFASVIADFRFDPLRQTWRMDNPYSMNLEMVARSKPEGRLSWKSVFGLTQLGFHNVGLEPKHQMATESMLGTLFPYSDRRMFYAQSAAAASYLIRHEREKLLEFVKAYYTRKADAIDIEDLFGMSEVKLGAKIRDHAIEHTSQK